MIIGHGSLAKLLQDREGAILFAAGVGNSRCRDDNEFLREMSKVAMSIIQVNVFKESLFYFSSINAQVKCSFYYNHKTEVEELIKRYCNNYWIIRLGNIWECTNPNTFLNYISSHPQAEIRQDEIKYMIHADELNMICQSLPLTGKHEISVFSDMLTVRQCLERKNPR